MGDYFDPSMAVQILAITHQASIIIFRFVMASSAISHSTLRIRRVSTPPSAGPAFLFPPTVAQLSRPVQIFSPALTARQTPGFSLSPSHNQLLLTTKHSTQALSRLQVRLDTPAYSSRRMAAQTGRLNRAQPRVPRKTGQVEVVVSAATIKRSAWIP